MLEAISALSWRLRASCSSSRSAIVAACDTLGWRYAFRDDRVPFGALLSARLAGEAFNATTATVGGGKRSRRGWCASTSPWRRAPPSLIVAKTTITIGQALFLLAGVIAGIAVLPSGSPLLLAMQWLLVAEIVAVLGFVLVQIGGALGYGGRLLQRLGLLGSGGDTVREADRALATFYRQEPVRLALSTLFHFLGWALGALETWIILAALGIPVSLSTALVIDAIDSGIGFALFLVPLRLGVLEVGTVAVFTALGLGAPVGLTVSLVRRVREAAWAGMGFLALAGLREEAARRPSRRWRPRSRRMCGIAGFIAPVGQRADSRILERMLGTLRHRGPDAVGTYVHGRAALGTARLRVIDLETGDQPIANEDGSVLVVHNGEIYNFPELQRTCPSRPSLRDPLRHRGHRPRVEEHGEHCVDYFNGMFALAVWDRHRERCSWRATAWARSPCTTPPARLAGLRLRAASGAGPPRGEPRDPARERLPIPRLRLRARPLLDGARRRQAPPGAHLDRLVRQGRDAPVLGHSIPAGLLRHGARVGRRSRAGSTRRSGSGWPPTCRWAAF